MTTSQKVLWLPNIGAKFSLGKKYIPEPGPGEILVQLEAVALNPIDWMIRRSGFIMVKKYPIIVGVDAAGIVQRVGKGVTNLSEGDKVFFQPPFGSECGAYQEYCLTNAALASKIPPNISFDQAASISTGFIAFAVATYSQQPHGLGLTPPFEQGGLGKYANQPIVIMGGASSVGQYAIQLARLSGFSPIITTASPRNRDLLLSLGATHVLDRWLSATSLRKQVSNITDAPITYVFDAISIEETQRAAFSLLASGGTLAVVHEPCINSNSDMNDKKILTVIGTFHIPPFHALGTKFSVALTEWLATGAIKPNRIEVLQGGLSGVPHGLRRLEAHQVSATKLVVRPAETPEPVSLDWRRSPLRLFKTFMMSSFGSYLLCGGLLLVVVLSL